jgi:hypothetical protein
MHHAAVADTAASKALRMIIQSRRRNLIRRRRRALATSFYDGLGENLRARIDKKVTTLRETVAEG